MTCPRNDSACGVYYTCGSCRRKENAAAYRRLTPAERAYDDYVDPAGAYHENFPSGCSCHISPPCSYCTRDCDDDSVPEAPALRQREES